MVIASGNKLIHLDVVKYIDIDEQRKKYLIRFLDDRQLIIPMDDETTEQIKKWILKENQ